MMDCRVVVEAAVPVYDVETADEAIRIAISKTGEMLNPDLNYVEIETGNRTSPGGEELCRRLSPPTRPSSRSSSGWTCSTSTAKNTRAASLAKRLVNDFGTFRWRCSASTRSRATPRSSRRQIVRRMATRHAATRSTPMAAPTSKTAPKLTPVVDSSWLPLATGSAAVSHVFGMRNPAYESLRTAT